jgi:hypothetical protein
MALILDPYPDEETTDRVTDAMVAEAMRAIERERTMRLRPIEHRIFRCRAVREMRAAWQPRLEV